MNTHRIVFAILAALAMVPLYANESERHAKIHFIIGPSNHPPGTHEVAAGARLLKHCVDQASSLSMLATALHEGWPEQPESLTGARAIVFSGDQFPPVRFKNTAAILEQLSRLADQGCGFVAVHYAIGVNRPAADNAEVQAMLDRLFGGFSNFIPVAEGGTVPRVMQATITPTKTGHPVTRGVRSFSLHDEPYYKNRFATKTPGSTFTPLATAMLPPEEPREEVVAWSIEHERGGRGVAIVMPHFYRNWRNDDLRKLVLNGICWAAGVEVPDNGIASTLPDLATFQPASVEP
jgi:type 1 glutamine amidotransferase